MSYTVYAHTGPTGKRYIGITRQRPEARWANGNGYKHSPHFRAAIKRYGWSSFSHEILAEGLTQAEAERMEIALIAQYQTTNPLYGYNADNGGNAPGSKSADTRRKISEALTGERHPLYGVKQDPDWVQRRAEKLRGHRVPPEHVNRLVALRSVPVKCVDTGEVYASATEAGRVKGVGNSKITAVCRGRRKTAGGLRWEYIEKESNT